MKNRNIFIPILLCILALVIVLGCLAVFPLSGSASSNTQTGTNSNGDTGNDSTDPALCAHTKKQVKTVFSNVNGNSFSAKCPSCGTEFLYQIETALTGNIPTVSSGVVSYHGGWSIGSAKNDGSVPYEFTSFDKLDPTGCWLTQGGQAWYHKNCFRLYFPAGVADPSYFAFGLGVRDIPPYDVGVIYTTQAKGMVKINLAEALYKYTDTEEVFDFQIFVDGDELLTDWVRIGNPDKYEDVDAFGSDKAAVIAAVLEKAKYNLNQINVNAGQKIVFAARYVDGTVDQAALVPSIEWVRFDDFLPCVEGCCRDNGNGSCRFCGEDLTTVTVEPVTASVDATSASTALPASLDLACLPSKFKHPTL